MNYDTIKVYSGNWKVTGINVNNSRWWSGDFQLQHDGRKWRCALTNANNPRTSPVCYRLTGQIKDVMSNQRLILDFKDGTTIHLNQCPQIKDLAMDLIQIKADILPGKASPCANKGSPSSDQFTGVKDKKKEMESENQEEENRQRMSRKEIMKAAHREEEWRKVKQVQEEFEECASKDKSHSFLEKGKQKSERALSNVSTGSFYSSTSTARHYGSFSTGKTVRAPGLLTNPERKRHHLGELRNNKSPSYSWTNRTSSFNNSFSPTSSLQGFSNLGNTCYMNAILQSLFGLDMFTTDLMNTCQYLSKHIAPDQRRNFLIFMLSNLLRVKKKEPSSIDVKKQLLSNVKKAISSSAKRFSGFEQHDAHEFLSQVLDQLKEEQIKLLKQQLPKAEEVNEENQAESPEANTPLNSLENQNNPTRENFEFKVLHRIECKKCAASTENLETFHDLSIDMPPRVTLGVTRSIQDALDHFFLPEELEYKCEKCDGSEANVQHKFSRLPRVLVLHLKRYTYNAVTSSNTKLGQSIIIPKFLTLQAQSEETTQPPQPSQVPYNFGTNEDAKSTTPVNSKQPFTSSSTGKVFEFKKRLMTPEPNLSRTPDSKKSSRRKLDLEAEESRVKKVIEMSEQTAEQEKEARLKQEALLVGDLTEDQMIQMALERSMKDEPIDSSLEPSVLPINNSTNENTSSVQHDENTTVSGDVQGAPPGPFDSDIDKDLEEAEEIYRAELRGAQGDILSSPQVEPPAKRSRLAGGSDLQALREEEHIDSAYSSFSEEHSNENNPGSKSEPILITDIADMQHNPGTSTELDSNGNEGTLTNGEVAAQTDGEGPMEIDNKDGLHLHLSGDEEDKENYTPPSSSPKHPSATTTPSKPLATPLLPTPGKGTGAIPLLAPPSKETQPGETDIKLHKDDDFDEEEQLRLAIENSLKDQAQLEQRQDEELEKARELSLQDSVLTSGVLCSPPERVAVSWQLNRSKQEQEALAVHAEKGDLPYCYQLVSVVSHLGSSSTLGHYISDVYDLRQREWYSWDDTRVSKIQEDDIRKNRERSGYIFFYVSKDVVDELEEHYYQQRRSVRTLSTNSLLSQQREPLLDKKVLQLSSKSTRFSDIR